MATTLRVRIDSVVPIPFTPSPQPAVNLTTPAPSTLSKDWDLKVINCSDANLDVLVRLINMAQRGIDLGACSEATTHTITSIITANY